MARLEISRNERCNPWQRPAELNDGTVFRAGDNRLYMVVRLAHEKRVLDLELAVIMAVGSVDRAIPVSKARLLTE